MWFKGSSLLGGVNPPSRSGTIVELGQGKVPVFLLDGLFIS